MKQQGELNQMNKGQILWKYMNQMDWLHLPADWLHPPADWFHPPGGLASSAGGLVSSTGRMKPVRRRKKTVCQRKKPVLLVLVFFLLLFFFLKCFLFVFSGSFTIRISTKTCFLWEPMLIYWTIPLIHSCIKGSSLEIRSLLIIFFKKHNRSQRVIQKFSREHWKI